MVGEVAPVWEGRSSVHRPAASKTVFCLHCARLGAALPGPATRLVLGSPREGGSAYAWLADRLEGGDRLKKSEPLLEGAAPLSFFTDAKAEASRAWIGGFLELVDGCQGPWFSLEVEKSWAPWAFAKGDPNKVIAALELLATLVGVRLWVPDGDAKKTSRVAIRGYTDNQSNEALLKKAMTTKFPPTLILMELAGELSAKNCELQLQWVRRDLNRLADDLTNENLLASARTSGLP